jgi:hypothetical protein
MATSSDSKTIDRESNKISLADRYKTQKAGGAYNVQQNVKTNGANEISLGGSTFDTKYTTTKGYKLQMGLQQTEFKDAVSGTKSLQQSVYLKGFSDTKYGNALINR